MPTQNNCGKNRQWAWTVGKAIKAGAIDFLTKPASEKGLLDNCRQQRHAVRMHQQAAGPNLGALDRSYQFAAHWRARLRSNNRLSSDRWLLCAGEHLERRRRYQPRWPRMPRSAAGRPSVSSAPRKLRIRGRRLWYGFGMDFKLGTSTKVGFAFLVFSAGPARRNQCNETCARRFLPA